MNKLTADQVKEVIQSYIGGVISSYGAIAKELNALITTDTDKDFARFTKEDARKWWITAMDDEGDIFENLAETINKLVRNQYNPDLGMCGTCGNPQEYTDI